MVRAFCDGTRRYGVPAPFCEEKTFFNVYFEGILGYRHLFRSVKKISLRILVRDATEN